MTRAYSTILGTLIATMVLALLPAPAAAQTNDIEPTHVTVTRPNDNPAPLRCFAGRVWYPVADLEMGAVLLADGERDGFYRVNYPAGVPAVVRASDVQYDESAGTVTISNATALQARNFKRPTSVDSYKDVLESPLSEGTVLTAVGQMRDDGRLTGYFVIPPDSARAWVNTRHVRPSTPEEIASFNASLVAESEPAPAEETTTEQPAPQIFQPPAATPSPVETESANGAAEETNEPTEDSAPAPSETDAIEPDAQTDPSADPSADNEPAPTQTEAEEADEPEVDTRTALLRRFATLDESYDAIRKQATPGAEISPLIEEYRGVREEARMLATGDADMQRLVEYAQARIQLLELRAEVQQTQAKLAQLSERTDATSRTINEARQRLMRARGYAYVGILSRSSLYTGDALPLRYRLLSQTGDAARSLAYLEIDDELDVTTLLGKEVGVIAADGTIVRRGTVPVVEARIVERADSRSGG